MAGMSIRTGASPLAEDGIVDRSDGDGDGLEVATVGEGEGAEAMVGAGVRAGPEHPARINAERHRLLASRPREVVIRPRQTLGSNVNASPDLLRAKVQGAGAAASRLRRAVDGARDPWSGRGAEPWIVSASCRVTGSCVSSCRF
jgi:hypothetical protein